MHRLPSAIRRVIIPLALGLPLTGCSLVARVTGGFESPALELQASKVESVSLAVTHVVFELAIHNPNAYALRSRELRYRLTVDQTVVAEGVVDVTAPLPPRSSAPVYLPVDVGLDRLLNAAPAAMVLGEIPYNLDVWVSVDSWLRQRQVHLVTSSVLRLNLPLGLARGSVVAFPDPHWQS